MKGIPKRFQIGPHTWKVRVVSREEMARIMPGDDPPPLGLTTYIKNEILVQQVRPGFSISQQKHCFWHEYFHALLFSAGRSKLSHDEDFVDLLGLLTSQAVETMKF